MFDQVAIKKHGGSPSVLLENKAEQNRTRQKIKSVSNVETTKYIQYKCIL